MSNRNETAHRERLRLAALDRYDVMDTPREPTFDELAALTARLCDTPIAVVNLVGDGRQFFKAEVGLGVRETPLHSSFCAHALLEEDFLIVPDLRQDARFDCNPLVTGEPHIRAYAGALLKTEDGLAIGTLCVLDYRPRAFTEVQQETLRVLASQVMAQLDLRRSVQQLDRQNEALRAGEERLQLILDSARDYAIIATDTDRRITSWSAGAQSIFDWTIAEALGRSIDDIFLPQDRAQGIPAQEFDRAAAEGYAPDVRWHRKPDGALVFLNGSTHPIRDGEDRIIGFLKIGRNETEERARAAELARTRVELVDSEDRFRNMADHAPVMMWVTDADGTCTYLNRRWYEYTGQTREEALGHGWLEATHPDDRAEAARIFEQANTTHTSFRIDYRLRRADGSYGWAIDAASPRFGPDGEFLGYIGSVIDIADRRAAEDALRHANALLAAVMEAVPGVVYAKDRQGRMLLGNAGTTALIGVPPERYLGRTDAEFLADPEQARRIMATDRRIMMTGVLEQVEEEVSLADGESAIWLSTKAPLRNAAGEVIGLVGSSLDITARKRIEQEREALNEQLEQRVAAAIAEREQVEEVMRQSQKMEAVGQLTGGVAHDFNNLLTIIRSSVDLLRRPDLPDERRRRYLDTVSDTVDRAAKLTRQLLAFARRQALRPETFDACAKLDEVGDMLDTLTGARVDIALDLPGTPCFIHADVSQFETALVNMVVNARDAMDGSGTITLRVAADRPLPPIRGHGGGGGPFVAVSIVDSGEGIPSHHLASIFEPFFTTKGVGKGTGLGLSQVFGFAKQSGGDIDVDSVVGKGSHFTLYLPQVGAPMPQVETVTATATLRGQGSRVLVVEDNVDVGAFSSQILADLGYDADWVTSGESALAALGADGAGYDVVFSDVVMPGMGGLELARTLRERLPALPVILASGYSHVLAEDADHGFPLLHKPYSAEQLSGALRAVLRRRD